MNPTHTLQSRLTALDAEDAAAQASTRPVTLDQQAVGRLSRMDALQNQAMAQAQARRREAERVRIRAALKRIEEGEYGFCTDCGEEIEAKRLALSLVGDDLEPLARRRYYTQDATVEKLGEILRDNPKGVLVFRDELVGFLKQLVTLDRNNRRLTI